MDAAFPHEVTANGSQHVKEMMHDLVNAGCSFEYDATVGFGGLLRVDDKGREVLKR